MKTKLIIILLFALIGIKEKNFAQSSAYIKLLKDTLSAISDRTDNLFFKLHCQSMIDVINAKEGFTTEDEGFLHDVYFVFNNGTSQANPKQLSTYLERKRPFILAWKSPTDGRVSFSWFTPPANWDPEKSYPLYVQLHGYWSVASNTIEYMSYPFLNEPSTSFAFEDGYLLSPWGRGNLWYNGISETDIWECIDVLESLVNIDQTRKYLCGHSMGGYGTWHISHNSTDVWAAIGLHAAALSFISSYEVSASVANKLKNTPAFFICGTSDALLSINKDAYYLLRDAGNKNLIFTTFSGGHEYRQVDVEYMYSWIRNFKKEGNSTGINPVNEVSLNNTIAYPNPFKSEIKFKYTLDKTARVKLEIIDINGNLIELVKDTKESSGEYNVIWQPKKLPSGIYFYRLTIDTQLITGKLLYQK